MRAHGQDLRQQAFFAWYNKVHRHSGIGYMTPHSVHYGHAEQFKLWPALWTFTTNDAVVPTNNAAEQALRSIVLKRKISGPTRSLRGDQFLARGFSVHETCLRQGVDLWEFMHQAMHAFIANTTPPSLLPRSRPSGAVPTG